MAGYPGHLVTLYPGMPRPSACQGGASLARTADPSPTGYRTLSASGRRAGVALGTWVVGWTWCTLGTRGYPGYTTYTHHQCTQRYTPPAVREHSAYGSPWCSQSANLAVGSYWLSLGSPWLLVVTAPLFAAPLLLVPTSPQSDIPR